jgi:fructose-bisphosphate aldolase class II
MPLVLHGGTGIPDQQVKKAISLGVAKVNVNTECQIVFAQAVGDYMIANKADLKKNANKSFDPRKVLKPGMEAIKNKCIEKFKIFGSVNRAK